MSKTYSLSDLTIGLSKQISSNYDKAKRAGIIVEREIGFNKRDYELRTIVNKEINNRYITTNEKEFLKKEIRKYAWDLIQNSIKKGLIMKIESGEYKYGN